MAKKLIVFIFLLLIFSISIYFIIKIFNVPSIDVPETENNFLPEMDDADLIREVPTLNNQDGLGNIYGFTPSTEEELAECINLEVDQNLCEYSNYARCIINEGEFDLCESDANYVRCVANEGELNLCESDNNYASCVANGGELNLCEDDDDYVRCVANGGKSNLCKDDDDYVRCITNGGKSNLCEDDDNYVRCITNGGESNLCDDNYVRECVAQNRDINDCENEVSGPGDPDPVGPGPGGPGDPDPGPGGPGDPDPGPGDPDPVGPGPGGPGDPDPGPGDPDPVGPGPGGPGDPDPGPGDPDPGPEDPDPDPGPSDDGPGHTGGLSPFDPPKIDVRISGPGDNPFVLATPTARTGPVVKLPCEIDPDCEVRLVEPLPPGIGPQNISVPEIGYEVITVCEDSNGKEVECFLPDVNSRGSHSCIGELIAGAFSVLFTPAVGTLD